ncbi:13173_t:CDS:1, partial [Entrophospora sp. SA101]
YDQRPIIAKAIGLQTLTDNKIENHLKNTQHSNIHVHILQNYIQEWM